MKGPRRSIGIGAALSFLLLGAPTDGAAAAAEDPPAAAQGGQGEESRADAEELPPARNRPATPVGTPAPQSNARAQQVTCGQVITQNTVLRNDVGPCPGDGIVIGADNIFLNLNGHRVLGNSDHGASGEFAGIRLPGRTGVTVTGRPGGLASGQMATVSGFEAGVVIGGGSANIVEQLTVRDNIGPDDPFNAELGDGIILFDSASNHIVDNVVAHNGIFDGIGVLGGEADGNLIQGNTVKDTVGPSDGGPAGQGVIVNGAGLELGCGQLTCPPRPPSLITGSRVVDNVIRGNASGGSANVATVGAEIVRNVVEDNGLTNGQGNGIGIQPGLRARDIPTRALVQDNEVHGNGWDGIHIAEWAWANRIIDNNAANNNALSASPGPFFDLRDHNRNADGVTEPMPPGFWLERPPGCDANVWSGNAWGSGLYFPSCTSAGGSGPPLPPPVPEGPYGDPTCSDGFDNDHDDLIDRGTGLHTVGDPGCAPPEGPEGNPSCGNHFDDDEDGLADGADPDCQSDTPPVPEGPFGEPTCSDYIDNDRDGRIDGADPDCARPGEGLPGSRQCSDGIDNDRDRLIDGDDPDCQAPRGEGRPGSRECADGIDNDRDRLIDGDDPDCQEPIEP